MVGCRKYDRELTDQGSHNLKNKQFCKKFKCNSAVQGPKKYQYGIKIQEVPPRYFP